MVCLVAKGAFHSGAPQLTGKGHPMERRAARSAGMSIALHIATIPKGVIAYLVEMEPAFDYYT
jgi:hypothetical protein